MTPSARPSPAVHRRAFLATTAIAIPSLALARGATGGVGAGADAHEAFEEAMEQAGDALKAMRGPLRRLDDPAQREQAALLANQIAMHMTQAIANAEGNHIPAQATSAYGQDAARFVKDLRIQITEGASASIALARALWQGDDEAVQTHYDALRSARKQGHDAFKPEDD